MILLVAMLCFFAGQSSVNSFLIPIGERSGLTNESAGYIVGAGMIFALAGAAAARLIGDRFGLIAPLLIGGLLLAVDVMVLTAANSPAVFAGGAILVSTGTIFAVPYFFTALARAGANGRYAALGPAFLLAGVSLGPLVASVVVGRDGYALLGVTASSLIAIGVGVAALRMRAMRLIDSLVAPPMTVSVKR